ncbi:3-hydroxyacyl-[acyl-carrier-protein] dehydratase FabZ [Phycisphaerae bacterium RAS1]|nr:3-hydroxyacyl-[acyl-carrier-protein] dehydratase FabZ [Phycisphaerae bacterium RAS1]
MRWIWIDRFEQFEPGKRAVSVKNVTLAEDHLHDHFPDYPVMPASLMIEGMAQTAGILVGEARQFAEKVILAKVKQATFLSLVRPGEQIRYEATIEHLTDSAASTLGRITSGDQQVGQVDLVFSHIDQNMSGLEFPEENFVFTEEFMSLLKMYRGDGASRVKL